MKCLSCFGLFSLELFFIFCQKLIYYHLSGDSQWLNSLSIAELLPTLKHYITYEGSLTQPACHETVQWILLNKPLYMNTNQFHLLRNSLKSDGQGDNYRPIQPLNHRSLRSSIYNTNEVSHIETLMQLKHWCNWIRVNFIIIK